MKLEGADHLRARFRGLRQLAGVYPNEWAVVASDNMKRKIRSPTGRMRASITPVDSGEVWADYRVTFIDKGTKPHEIAPKRRRSLRFDMAGTTVFAKRARHPGSRKRPFIRTAARKALKDHPPTETMIELWNAAGAKAKTTVLGAKAAARRRRR